MDISALFTILGLTQLLSLTIMEIVLGIDNVIFISILTGKLPKKDQGKARSIGLSLALIFRIGLLFGISWIISLKTPLFSLEDIGIDSEYSLSGRDLILLFGGLFLTYKSVGEIMERFHGEHDEDEDEKKGMSLSSAIAQIVVLDIVFSIDSILTAVGMVDNVFVMIGAVIIALMIMLSFSGAISDFVNNNPNITMLALCFLVLVGFKLIVEGLHPPGFHFPSEWLYVAIGFSIIVESLNMLARSLEQKRLDKEKEHEV
jgi:predicted tellurium resistance membrane protein TerC